jgi:glutamate formiminotransferase
MKKIIECVPNFSEGRDVASIDKIISPFKTMTGVKLLDTQRDEDHNRLVVTVIGEPEELGKAVLMAMGKAISAIDMRRHKGQHPRMGAVDVVPFIPVKNVTLADAVALSKVVAAEAAQQYNLPIYLYEESATQAERKNLATIRKGQFEGMAQKMKEEMWSPDFGPDTVHPTAGVTAVGARMPLVAYNVNLDTNDLEIATSIARKVRHINGGFRYCKALGIELEDRGIVQVSMNMTDYTQTALYQVFELIRVEARRYGVSVLGSEIVGLVPMATLVDTASYYLGLENFSQNQVLESRIYE